MLNSKREQLDRVDDDINNRVRDEPVKMDKPSSLTSSDCGIARENTMMIEEMKTTCDKLVQLQVQHDKLQIRLQEIEKNCLENISGKPNSDRSKMKEAGRQTLSNRVIVKHKKNGQWIRKMKDVKSGNELCEFEKENVLEKFCQLQNVGARQKRKLRKLEN
jgi:hypothetical protein